VGGRGGHGKTYLAGQEMKKPRSGAAVIGTRDWVRHRSRAERRGNRRRRLIR
jgi:hypothetical protein